MAEIFLEPNDSSLQVGQDSEVELLYSLDDELANADQSDLGTNRIGVSILFNENELDLATDAIAVENGSIADIRSIDDETDDVDQNGETTERILVQVESLPIGFSETRPLLTIPVNGTDQFDGSVINFTVPNNPIDTSFPNESSVQLNQEGGVELPTVSIEATDADAAEEGPDPGTFTITRTGDTAEALTVNFTVEGTATEEDDYAAIGTTVEIAAGDDTADVTITPVDDQDIEEEETVELSLAADEAYEIDNTANTDTVTIADNDDTGEPTVELSVDSSEGSEEGETVFTFTATASEPVTGEQTVDLALSGDGDADAEDFVGDLPAAITIADGQTTGTVDVTVNDDDVEEGEETANFALENPPEGFVLGANTNVDITIEDNDPGTPGELQGDFNDDGITNLDDLGLFAAAFGSDEGDANYDPAVDLNGDTSINNDDLGQLATFFTEEFAV